jgi:hypothetical protein
LFRLPETIEFDIVIETVIINDWTGKQQLSWGRKLFQIKKKAQLQGKCKLLLHSRMREPSNHSINEGISSAKKLLLRSKDTQMEGYGSLD